ncbi:unnamed protein product [marine sediment metagenome]|uniref:ArnR1-like winged helix-turn-helix domain-containing protein n=1 Tax=marine sediment metagenome TaxID=412755 RepID=X1FBV7_9ZZZZ
MLSILAVIRDGKDKPTNIVYATNSSWKRTQIMLSDLMGQDLLEMRITPRLSRKRYVITEKGVKLLEHFKKAKEMLPEIAYLAHAVSS